VGGFWPELYVVKKKRPCTGLIFLITGAFVFGAWELGFVVDPMPLRRSPLLCSDLKMQVLLAPPLGCEHTHCTDWKVSFPPRQKTPPAGNKLRNHLRLILVILLLLHLDRRRAGLVMPERLPINAWTLDTVCL
jgi:hypothetical protein